MQKYNFFSDMARKKIALERKKNIYRHNNPPILTL